MGDAVNHFLDNLQALVARLLDLPVTLLVASVVVGMLAIALLLNAARKRRGKQPFGVGGILLAIAIGIVAIVADRKVYLLETQINDLHTRLVKRAGAPPATGASDTAPSVSGTPTAAGTIDGTPGIRTGAPSAATSDAGASPRMLRPKPYKLETLLGRPEFENLEVIERRLDEATDLIIATKENPKAVVFCAIIDLRHPDLEIVITPSLEMGRKVYTTDFARYHGCSLAINGEAGRNPEPDCDFGEWIGNWISKGNPVLLEDSDKRPFLSFDEDNVARYYEAAIVDREVTPEKYNTIWGRWDIVIDGEIVTTPQDWPYSRTIMGINKPGNRLYLMVVDGKRPEYSMGLTFKECAIFLKALGAYNIMACDQGGSSCMYIEQDGGIINRPADSDGLERPVYSHFGVKLN